MDFIKIINKIIISNSSRVQAKNTKFILLLVKFQRAWCC